MAKRTDKQPQHLFFNRDQSWLRFNRRVLEEAQDAGNPLLERVKFLSITASNLDEFTEVRVAAILQRIEDGYRKPVGEDDDGLSEQQRLDILADQMHSFAHDQYACWKHQILPALATAGIRILPWKDLSEEAREHANTYFDREVDPLLTPVTIDPSHPFPRVLNKALCIALLLRRKRAGNHHANNLGIVTVPRSLSRLVRLPTDGPNDFLFLHELIEARAERMFPGYQILASAPFRVTRNSNLYLQEEESRSLLESVREELHNRRKGDVVRLEIEAGADEAMLEQLRVNFELDRWQIFRSDGPVNLTRIADLYAAVDCADLKFAKFVGRQFTSARGSDGKEPDIFETLRRGDILLHHPFDSYDTVEQFIKTAAADDNVVSIKQTLYRTSTNSPMFQALVDAATSADVTVVVELTARFDEDSNIRWARNLEDAGVQVFHGIVGLKTHAKLALLVRRDPDGVTRRYAHLGTGNYNSVTARFYTDISLLTANEDITCSVSRIFNYLTADAELDNYYPLLVAPTTLAHDLLHLIDRETEHAHAGRPAHIIAKMNALIDEKTIRALYRASAAGVEIDLIVRGMCALRPGVPGMSENIRVRSIVGRFLEHSRIFWFANGTAENANNSNDDADKSEVYCGSADWMARNLYERCEEVFPVTDPDARRRLRNEILETYLRDTVKARLLTPDGDYIRTSPGPHPVDAQQRLMRLAAGDSSPLPPVSGREKIPDRPNQTKLALAKKKAKAKSPLTKQPTPKKRSAKLLAVKPAAKQPKPR